MNNIKLKKDKWYRKLSLIRFLFPEEVKVGDKFVYRLRKPWDTDVYIVTSVQEDYILFREKKRNILWNDSFENRRIFSAVMQRVEE